MATAELDPFILGIVARLSAEARLAEIAAATARARLAEGKRERQADEKAERDELVRATAVEVLASWYPILLLSKLAGRLSPGFGAKVRAVLFDSSLDSALKTLLSTLDARGGARRRRLNAAYVELERARAHLEDSTWRERDLFVVNLAQAFCATQLDADAEEARAWYGECAEAFGGCRARLAARTNALGHRARKNEQTAEGLRKVVEEGGEEAYRLEFEGFRIRKPGMGEYDPLRLPSLSSQAGKFEREARGWRQEVERGRADESRLALALAQLRAATELSNAADENPDADAPRDVSN